MSNDLVEGGIYSVESGNGDYSVVKILVLEPKIVHARLYINKYASRPTSIDPADLSMGSIFDGDFGIGHAPISRDGFVNWNPVLLLQAPVTEDELVGYRMWKEQSTDS